MNAWFFIDHPQQVLYAMGVKNIIDPLFSSINLVVSRHGYWNDPTLKLFSRNFDSWLVLNKPQRPKFLNREHIFIKFVIPLLKNKSILQGLPIKLTDVIFCFSGAYSYVENMAISLFPGSKKILIKIKEDISVNHQISAFNVVINLLEYLIGLHPTVSMPPGEKFPRFTAYKQDLSSIFQHVGFFENISQKIPPYVKDSLYFPQFSIPRSNKHQNKKIVVLFGQVQPGYEATNPINIVTANKIISYLRHFYGGKFQLVYKPHPLEQKNFCKLNLTGFHVDHTPAEAFFQRELNRLHTTFSFCSSVSAMAFNLGLPSYTFYPLIKLPRNVKKTYQLAFSGLPKRLFITTLDSPPPSYSIEKYISRARQYNYIYLTQAIAN